MEDLDKILQLSETYPMQLEQMTEEFLLRLRVILWGQAAVAATNKEKIKDITAASPQQTKKRAKHLASLSEVYEHEENLGVFEEKGSEQKSPSQKSTASSSELSATTDVMKNSNNPIETEAPVAAPRTKCVYSTTDMEIGEYSTPDNLRKSEATSLMPPPPLPTAGSADETLYKRPQRAAKLKSEKNLKEPKLGTKLRRPDTDEVKVKLEHEQRSSQMHESSTNTKSNRAVSASSSGGSSKDSLSSQKSDDSVLVIMGKQPSIITINSDVEDTPNSSTAKYNEKTVQQSDHAADFGIRDMRIKIKREKISFDNRQEIPKASSDEAVFKAPTALQPPAELTKTETTTMKEPSLASSTLSSNATINATGPPKKSRKKKDVVHKPIKVERFSDLDKKASPISSRTRHGKTDANEISQAKETKRSPSVYEDAVEAPPSHNSAEKNQATTSAGIVNETINVAPCADVTMNLGPVPGDATFCTNPAQTTFQVAPSQTTFVMDSNPNATMTLDKPLGNDALADATFDVHKTEKTGKNKDDDGVAQRSFETAKDSSSLLTEDEQEKQVGRKQVTPSASAASKGKIENSISAKAARRMPNRNELFNPLAQSPVKMRVEAFENAAAAASEQSKRPLRNKKENIMPVSSTTPIIGKLQTPTLGRFLTPTQSSNLTTANSTTAKKRTTSASKALPMPKSANAASLYRSNSTVSTKTLQRENSTDEFRKGLHNLAEERKRQREQKHLLAAQQREAKERERAERMAKLAKEREEKRILKKQQEQEQKKRELEEIQRKIRQQQEEEAAKLKAAKAREMQLQMKQQQQQQLAKQQMMPPPPRTALKYTFEMLHEDDSTDDEDKVSYKRPQPPTWSRSHVRGPFVLKQEYTPTACIDSFFSVQPMTPDLKLIFPNIDARHLKRNSSALWKTPPRYSELPKY